MTDKKGQRILVVEDETALRESLKHDLTAAGHAVDAAAAVGEPLDHPVREPVEVVLRVESPADAGLVGDDDGGPARPSGGRDEVEDAVDEVEILPPMDIAMVEVDHPVAVEEEGARRHQASRGNIRRSIMAQIVWPATSCASWISGVEVAGGSGGIKVAVFPADGAKCERCWKHSESVGKKKEHPNLCGRCTEVVSTGSTS
jgi:CheY-like chemotaxis protein